MIMFHWCATSCPLGTNNAIDSFIDQDLWSRVLYNLKLQRLVSRLKNNLQLFEVIFQVRMPNKTNKNKENKIFEDVGKQLIED